MAADDDMTHNMAAHTTIAPPYASVEGSSLRRVLVGELTGGRWKRFRAAVAFAKASGNTPDLLDALGQFASRVARSG